jgi:hypothetical protein
MSVDLVTALQDAKDDMPCEECGAKLGMQWDRCETCRSAVVIEDKGLKDFIRTNVVEPCMAHPYGKDRAIVRPEFMDRCTC